MVACRQVIVLIEFEGNRRNALINFPIKQWGMVLSGWWRRDGKEVSCTSPLISPTHHLAGIVGQWRYFEREGERLLNEF